LPVAATGPDGLPVTLEMQVPTSFVDYNGHMNEAPYLEVGARASDRFMEMIGADAEYIAGGLSYFTAENHIRYLAEIDIGDRITVTTQALGGDGRKLHLLHRFWTGGEGPAATVETLMLHVDLSTRRVVAPEGVVAERAVHPWFPHIRTMSGPTDWCSTSRGQVTRQPKCRLLTSW
jgi:carnitine 3-dehydrogenase